MERKIAYTKLNNNKSIYYNNMTNDNFVIYFGTTLNVRLNTTVYTLCFSYKSSTSFLKNFRNWNRLFLNVDVNKLFSTENNSGYN